MTAAKKLANKPVDEKVLRRLVPLGALSADRLRELADKTDTEQLPAGRTLFKLGDATPRTYYLLAGEIEIQLASGQNVIVKSDTPAALHPLSDVRPRQATVVTKSASTFLAVDSGLLEILVNYDRRSNYEVNEISAEDHDDWMSRFLQTLSAMNVPIKNLEYLLQRMEEFSLKAGEPVIRQADADTRYYYVIKEGRCVVTKQTGSGKTPIRIAELREGSGFGEEALLANLPRGATITMLTDGRLMRLPKADFTQLIAEPALQFVDHAEAEKSVEAGAVWLDVRNEIEFRRNALPGAVNIPLSATRHRARELNVYGKYVAYCDTGSRATAAAFVLRQLGYTASVLRDGAAALDRNAAAHKLPAPVAGETSGELKPADASAETGGESARLRAAAVRPDPNTAHELDDTRRSLMQARKEAEALRAQLKQARDAEQDVTHKLSLARSEAKQAAEARAGAEQEAQRLRAEAERIRQRTQDELRQADRQAVERSEVDLRQRHEELRQAREKIDEYALSLASTEATLEATHRELEQLREEYDRARGNWQREQAELSSAATAQAAAMVDMKQQLEHEMEQKRAAEEALRSAEREAARLKAEAESAQKRADELARRAAQADAAQSGVLQEVKRRIEAAELLRLEAEKQAQQLKNEADTARRRAEEEAKRVAEVEAARLKALAEGERRAKLAEELRRKAEDETARLKTEAETARAAAEEARRASQAAELARRQIEERMQRQAETVSTAQRDAALAAPGSAEGGELEELEHELARLQQKLESKKRVAIERKEELDRAAVKAEPDLVQNVYDISQKTQRLPAMNPNQGAPTDVGKVRKSGWVSDAILWETTLGLREDSDADSLLDDESAPPPGKTAATTRAPAPQAPAPRPEPPPRAVASGEFRAQQSGKRSVFTARDLAPPVTPRKVDVSRREKSRVGLFAGIAVAVVAAILVVVIATDKTGTSKEKIANIIDKTTPGEGVPAPVNKILNAIPGPKSADAAKTAADNAVPETAPVQKIVDEKTTAAAREPGATAVKPKAETAKAPAKKETTAKPVEAAPALPAAEAPATPPAAVPVENNAATGQAAAVEPQPAAAATEPKAPAVPNDATADAPTAEETKPAVREFSDLAPVN